MGRISLRQPKTESVRVKSRWKLFMVIAVTLNSIGTMALLLKVFEVL
jgi:nitrate reductase NapE component